MYLYGGGNTGSTMINQFTPATATAPAKLTTSPTIIPSLVNQVTQCAVVAFPLSIITGGDLVKGTGFGNCPNGL